MKEAEVIRSLKAVAKEKIIIKEESKNSVIEKVIAMDIPVRHKGSFKEFVISQIGFVNKIVWFWQGVWILLFFYAIWSGELLHITNETLCILSMAPPLLLLLTIEEVSRVYNRSMLEIEYATKYSLKKVVLVRMMILSIVNGVLMLCGILFAKQRLDLKFVEILVYSLTPLLVMTFLLLKMMTRWNGERLKYAAASLYLFLLLLIVVGRMERFNIYTQNLFGVWLLLFFCGLIATIFQIIRLGKQLDCFELLMN